MKRQADNEDLANFWRKHQADFLALVSPPLALFQVFDVLPDVYFFVKNASGQTLFCSRNLPSHHGFRSVEEMLGKTDQELTPGPMADAILADDQAIYETGQPLLKKMELWVDLLGLPTWHLCSKFPLKDR
ncbi:MAG: PAS domain-containing protein, partial [Pirellulaceae bacterium]